MFVTFSKEPGVLLDFHTKEMKACGLYDATHVTMLRCPTTRSNKHMGSKANLPSRTYNIWVNHRCQILHTTRGHPAYWNDKTLAIFDTFVMQLRTRRNF